MSTVVTLPAITLWQPWASLLIYGPKQHETRSWRMPPSIAGRDVLIHAGLREVETWREVDGLAELVERLPQPLPRGAAVGVALAATSYPAVPDRAASREDWLCGWWEQDRHAWRFDAPRAFDEPIPMRGNRGIWRAELDERALDSLREVLAP